MKIFRYLLTKRYAPRWLILQIDLFFSVLSIILAYLLFYNFNPNASRFDVPIAVSVGIVLAVRLIGFYLCKTYHGVVRYTSTEDAKRIFVALSSGTLLLVAISVADYYNNQVLRAPLSVLIIEYFCTTVLMTSFRIFVKIIYTEIKNSSGEKLNVVIFGAGEAGLIAKRTIDHDKDSGKRIIGFFDDDAMKKGKSLEGVKIYNFDEQFNEILTRHRIGEMIIAVQEFPRKRKEEVVDLCLRNKIHVKAVPPAIKWINGELSANQISDIKIEDLLEREPIRLNQDGILSQLKDKRVLVTGACGSIGSELVRQIVRFYPKEIILVDQAETPLYELELELRETSGYVNFKFLIGDVYNREKMDKILAAYPPEIIYHAAAYKHVPLMEENPSEAVMTNIIGTRNMADLALKYQVKTFVFISTDKAVNPTNVMGASKRVAEIYVQSLNSYLESQNLVHTKFITTRFGNVLGSNGSVIPRFSKQLAAGGPITVTHPEISRFFMTIPEACQLILEAGMMGNGGEIYVFDMGEPVRIADLAKKMITLSGLTPGKDIQIVFTGLRPGEKIIEELLNNKEKTLPTHHEKIMIGKVREYSFDVIQSEIDELKAALRKNDDFLLVSKIKAIVPEYISNNSRYEELDKLQIHPEIKVSH